MRADAPHKAFNQDDHCGMNDLCIRALMRRAFGLFWDHAPLLICVHVILLLILIAGNYQLKVGGNLLLGPFVLGAFKITLRISRNENTELSDILSGFEYFLPAFLANILINLIAILVVPSVIGPLLVFLTYSVTYLFILEENLGFWTAMEKSRKMVWGNFKRWLSLGVVIIAVNLAGIVCLGIGLLATVPFSHLLIALAYDEELIAQRKRDESRPIPSIEAMPSDI